MKSFNRLAHYLFTKIFKEYFKIFNKDLIHKLMLKQLIKITNKIIIKLKINKILRKTIHKLIGLQYIMIIVLNIWQLANTKKEVDLVKIVFKMVRKTK